MKPVLRVVVVDDSPFVCRLLAAHLQSAPDIQVVGTALSGARALELIKELRPDTVTLDLEMPGMNGLEALERIMHDCPTPVLVVSGVSRRSATTTLQALDCGAVDFILKYTPGVDTNPDSLRHEIVAKVRMASRIKVIRSLHQGQATQPASDVASPAESGSGSLESSAINRLAAAVLGRSTRSADDTASLPGSVLVIGASTGGPIALRELLGNLPADFPAAVIVVQHMPATFTRVLAAQLDRQVELPVKEAESGDRLIPGQVLIAPGDFHLLVQANGRVELVRGPKVGGHRPSIDVTMQSVAQTFGARTSGVVLTGMGTDGALGLVTIRGRGGRTYAQDAASCVVNGMPQQAVDKGVVDHVAPPADIAHLLKNSYASHREKQLCLV